METASILLSQFLSNEVLALAIPAFMLVSAFYLFISYRKSETASNVFLILSWTVILVASAFLIVKGIQHPFLLSFEWFDFGKRVMLSYGMDHPGTLMMGLVVLVTFLVSFYSTEYMKGDSGYARYFASLFLFSVAMLGIVLSFNLLLTFIFWELVGFCSYLLINFWYHKPSANEAARKAFILNRIGDLGFVMGLGLYYAQFGSFELSEIRIAIAQGNVNEPLLFLAGFGIFLGCVGKSAQFPLLVWLPDAMQAPTPVSALLHAATMVAAGVFLMARIIPIISPDVLMWVAYIGAITSLIGAFSAACQTDIKKILAYSTVSQLGYMMAGLGSHSPFASLFHLFTHATFKASLFLAAGAIIHAMAHLQHNKATPYFDPQDIRLMGGLRKRMPFTFVAFMLACLAGAGVPLSAGFLSKDEILAAVCAWASVQANPVHWGLPLLVFCTSFMTAFYMGRMFFLVFFGGFRLGNIYPDYKGHSQHIHEPSLRMLIPYSLLSLFSMFIFFSFNPIDPEMSWLVSFLPKESSAFGVETSFLVILKEKQEIFHYGVIAISITVLTLGFLLSCLLYAFKTRYKLEFVKLGLQTNRWVALSMNGLYLNELYTFVFVKPFARASLSVSYFDSKLIDRAVDLTGFSIVALSNLTKWIDKYLVDGLVNASVWLLWQIGHQLRSLQNGKVQSYLALALSVILGVIIWLIV